MKVFFLNTLLRGFCYGTERIHNVEVQNYIESENKPHITVTWANMGESAFFITSIFTENYYFYQSVLICCISPK